ncbi:MAG: hypothetical protein IJ392_02405 [Clostridia bacterium]|nr:hypothetical protein [Clostridia bacterium]
MKIFEVMSELSKLPAGLDVQIRLSPEVEEKLLVEDDPHAFCAILNSLYVDFVRKPDIDGQTWVELLCEVR